jgi:hypothetical protein
MATEYSDSVEVPLASALASGADCRFKKWRWRSLSASDEGRRKQEPGANGGAANAAAAKRQKVEGGDDRTCWKGGTNTRRTYGGERLLPCRRRREPWRLNRDHEVYNPAKMAEKQLKPDLPDGWADGEYLMEIQ